MHIASLADHLDLIDTIAHWHRDQWGEATFSPHHSLSDTCCTHG